MSDGNLGEIWTAEKLAEIDEWWSPPRGNMPGDHPGIEARPRVAADCRMAMADVLAELLIALDLVSEAKLGSAWTKRAEEIASRAGYVRRNESKTESIKRMHERGEY